MCIENNKCLNFFSLQTSVVLIALSAIPEAAFYEILDKFSMIVFPIASVVLFFALLMLNKSKARVALVATLVYLVLQIIQLVVWALTLKSTFFADEPQGKIQCQRGKLVEN